jgi:hypothetical protein
MAGKKETRKLINQDGNSAHNSRSNSLVPTPAENAALNLSGDAKRKFERRGTMMFMTSALVQQMRMRR